MSYTETLKVDQKKAIQLMVKSMVKRGISNKFMQAGILAVISKETEFRPKSETGYGTTSNERIRKVFGSRVSKLSDQELNTIKADNVAFFNLVYGGKYGNGPDEGYKYRGRGLNQVTFKGNYQAMSVYTDSDIVGNPDLLNELEVAVDVCIGYFLRNFSNSQNKLGQYNMTNVNDAKSAEDAVGAAYHANAGWGKNKADLEKDVTNGRKKAFARVEGLLTLAKAVDTGDIVVEDTSNNGNNTNNNGLSASVGQGGKNNPADVILVKKLLNKAIAAGLAEDNANCGPKTIEAILKFQKEKMGILKPDGCVDVGGKTWKALNGASSNTVETAQIVPASLDAAVFPCFN